MKAIWVADGRLALLVGVTHRQGTHVTNDVLCDELRNGETTSAATVESGAMRLETVRDAADPQLGLFRPATNAR